MRIRYQKIRGKEVLADKEGRLLGSVRRLQVDSKKKCALGVVFKGKVMSGEHWSKVRGITRVGEDVLYLSSMKTVQDDEPPGRDIKDLLGLPVNTLDGRRLGSLEDLVLDTETWKIVGIVLDNGGSVDTGLDAVFGEDTLLLREGAGDEITEAPADQSGFLARVFNTEPEKPATRKKRTAKKKTSKKR